MTEREQQRKIKHRLAMLRHAEEVTGNVAATCRYYGISRQTLLQVAAPLRGARRGRPAGPSRAAASQSRTRPTPRSVGKIIYLRQHYHFGPLKISMYLKRYHDVEISHSGVWRILKRLEHEPAAGLAALQAPRPTAGSATRSSCPATGSRST